MPHISSFDGYIYPIIFDDNKDNGILIEFKIYGIDNLSSENDLYSLSYHSSDMKFAFSTIIKNDYYTLY